MNVDFDRCWLGQRVSQLEICGDIGDNEVSLENFLSQGFSIDGDTLVLQLGSSIIAKPAVLSHLMFMMTSVVMVS